MKLHELEFNKGARKANVRRKGRGHGSTAGKTSGRGHKGQKQRSKVDKHLYTSVYQNVDLQTILVKSMQSLMLNL